MVHSKFWNSCILLGMLGLTHPVWAVPSFPEVRARTISSEAVLYDRHQEVIHEQRMNSRFRQLPWISLSKVSPIFKKAILLSEDQRFSEHSGVDWKAILSSTAENLFRKRPRGASTITMQLASLVDHDLLPASKGRRRGLLQKIKQARVAHEIEKSWSKDQIFEAYLNLIPFRSELRGISAASYGLFGKAPDGLEFKEAIILAALVPSPQAPLDQVRARACALGQKLSPEFQCVALADLFAASGLHNLFITPQVALAPHVAHQLLKAPTAYSTLDLRLQKFVSESLKHQIAALSHRNVHDAAALVMDNATGDVLAYVGNVGELGSAYYVDGIRAKRQAGSTLKPFLYAMAFENRYLTPASLVDDTAEDFPVQGGVYRPRNYDQEFHGSNISVRTALASSLNVPAVRVLNLVGVDAFVRKLKALGMSHLEAPEFYGPSLALGSADVTLWDLVNAYRTLANHGRWSEPRLDMAGVHPLKSGQVISSEAAFLVSDILSDRESRSLTFGLDNPLAQTFWVAAKTGTSKDMRDNWCIGYSSRYTVGVWAGNFSGQPMWNVSGISGAAPAWSEIMRYLHAQLPSKAPTAPSGLVRVDEGSRSEWYLKGTEPPAAFQGPQKLATQTQVRITYPVDGTIIARDPDIPTEIQKVIFEHSSSAGPLKWKIDDQELPLGPHGQPSFDLERAGRFRVSLWDSHGLVDEVWFQVK